MKFESGIVCEFTESLTKLGLKSLKRLKININYYNFNKSDEGSFTNDVISKPKF